MHKRIRWAQDMVMKTRSRWRHLRGLFLLSVRVTLGSVLCVSAFAGPSTFHDSRLAQQQTAEQQRAQRKVVYLVRSSASPIPKPIAWVTGIPTTTTPMEVYGRGYVISR